LWLFSLEEEACLIDPVARTGDVYRQDEGMIM
jgi:hypothetical protein